MRADSWSRFAALSSADRRLYAVVTAHNADGSATATFPDGGTSRVSGRLDVAVPYGVFIRGDRIDDAAPLLPTFELDV